LFAFLRDLFVFVNIYIKERQIEIIKSSYFFLFFLGNFIKLVALLKKEKYKNRLEKSSKKLNSKSQIIVIFEEKNTSLPYSSILYSL